MVTDSQPIILVTIPVADCQRQALEAQAPGQPFLYCPAPDVTESLIRKARIIIGNVAPHLLPAATRLEWLHLNSAGAAEFLAPGILPPQARLTNSSGAYGLAISEHLLAMLLMIQKKLYLYRDNQADARWHDEGDVTSIEGSTTLVVGLGDIGGEFARKMKALGSRTIGIKRHPVGKPDYLDELATLSELDQLLPRADIVALCLPGTPETDHLFDRERLGRLKQTAILLNVGRGNVLDTEALCDWLSSGHLSGAGLDVTDPEPLPADHRLWGIRNAVITPHVSGFYHLPATLARIVTIAVRNLGRFMQNEPLENLVDFQTGYRRFPQS